MVTRLPGKVSERQQENKDGGGGGIRTLVTGVTGETVFETAAFNHSATPPHGVMRRKGRYSEASLDGSRINSGGEAGI